MTAKLRELLCRCRSVLRAYHLGRPEHELAEPPRRLIGRISAALGDAYDVETGQQADRTRPVEVMRCWSDSTWDTVMVDIPYHTPPARMSQVARRLAFDDLTPEAQAEVVQIDLFHVPGPDECEDAFADVGEQDMGGDTSFQQDADETGDSTSTRGEESHGDDSHPT